MIFFIGVFNYYLMFGSKMKNKNTTPVRTIPKSIIKIVERSKIDTLSTQIHDDSLFWLGTGTLIIKVKEQHFYWPKGFDLASSVHTDGVLC
jgi:tellurite resistance protein TehA-like permease